MSDLYAPNPFDAMTPVQRLTAALVLAITAADEQKAATIDFMLDSLAIGLTPEDVDTAKAAAEAEVNVRVPTTSTLPSPEELKKRRQA